MEEKTEHKTKIGCNILEMLMFNLYDEHKTIYREYLQNACDSINEAIAQGILESQNEGRVNIHIDKQKRLIKIEDNGTGISISSSEAVLKDIANSNKSIKSTPQAGFYGIGRLVGAGYCEKLTFVTSAKGEDVKSILSYDIVSMKKKLEISRNSEHDKLEACSVIDSVTSFWTEEEDVDMHYFRVILERVNNEYRDLLDEEEVYSYLAQVAPIPFSPVFTQNLLLTQLKKVDKFYSDCYKKLNMVKISTDNHYDINKLYNLHISGTGDEIKGLRFFTFEDEQYGKLAWGWYAITQFSKAIPQEDSSHNPVLTRGIRLRVHNIQIGNDDYFGGIKYFKQPRGNKYFNGEIHILHKDIYPTANRSGLAPTIVKDILEEKLKEFFNGELQKCYTEANIMKNGIKQVFELEQKLEEMSTIVSEDSATSEDKRQYDHLQQELTKQREKVNKNINRNEEENLGLKLVRDTIYKPLWDDKKKVWDETNSLSQSDKSKTSSLPCSKKNMDNDVNGNHNVKDASNGKTKQDPIAEKLEMLKSNGAVESYDMVEKILALLDKYHGQVTTKVIKSMKNAILDMLNERTR